jgi:NADH-quinone oxidoreductase subunit J
LAADALGFYVFAVLAVAASLLVIGQRSPIYSVLLLIASFAALAGLYVLLDAPFVAVIQIIIYAGAIMVLFLFVVMLLNAPYEQPLIATGLKPGGPTEKGALARGPRRLGAALGVGLLVELAWALWRGGAALEVRASAAAESSGAASSVRDIGGVLFNEYGFAFEVTSILILIAMVGAVVLAKRHI